MAEPTPDVPPEVPATSQPGADEASVNAPDSDFNADVVATDTTPSAVATPSPTDSAHSDGAQGDLSGLPPYTQSLLKIEVPVVVTLASKKQPVSQIVSLGPGSIISFDKPCDQMLDLEVGGQQIAAGEAVKIGDKFGLRINSITMPDERFRAARRPPVPPASE
jgi:flagellar motor switch protein FliN/FliY